MYPCEGIFIRFPPLLFHFSLLLFTSNLPLCNFVEWRVKKSKNVEMRKKYTKRAVNDGIRQDFSLEVPKRFLLRKGGGLW